MILRLLNTCRYVSKRYDKLIMNQCALLRWDMIMITIFNDQDGRWATIWPRQISYDWLYWQIASDRSAVCCLTPLRLLQIITIRTALLNTTCSAQKRYNAIEYNDNENLPLKMIMLIVENVLTVKLFSTITTIARHTLRANEIEWITNN